MIGRNKSAAFIEETTPNRELSNLFDDLYALESAVAEIRDLGTKYITAIHMKDTGGAHLGEGEVDFTAVGASILGTGYDGWLILETPTKDDHDASNQKNLDFTKALVVA